MSIKTFAESMGMTLVSMSSMAAKPLKRIEKPTFQKGDIIGGSLGVGIAEDKFQRLSLVFEVRRGTEIKYVSIGLYDFFYSYECYEEEEEGVYRASDKIEKFVGTGRDVLRWMYYRAHDEKDFVRTVLSYFDEHQLMITETHNYFRNIKCGDAIKWKEISTFTLDCA